MPCKQCEHGCKRRGRVLSPRHGQLCAERPEYAGIWDKHYGVVNPDIIPDSGLIEVSADVKIPRRELPKSATPLSLKKQKELGDVVEAALTKVGITEERVSQWLGRKCNCKSRREKLNKLSKWARNVLLPTDNVAADHVAGFDRITGTQARPIQ